MPAAAARLLTTTLATNSDELTLLWRQATRMLFTHRFSQLLRTTTTAVETVLAASSVPGLPQTVAGLGAICRARRAARSETARTTRVITITTGGAKESQWIRITPIGCSSTRSRSGLLRGRELFGTIRPAVFRTMALARITTQAPYTSINMLSRSCPARPVFWQSGTMAVSTERSTLTLPTKTTSRPGLTWTRG